MVISMYYSCTVNMEMLLESHFNDFGSELMSKATPSQEYGQKWEIVPVDVLLSYCVPSYTVLNRT